MEKISEDISCYARPEQRNLLIELSSNDNIRNNFFLTGGTALSVFYLHHRISDDIDLFTNENIDLNELDFWILRKWKDAVKTNVSEFMLSYLINNVKVDLVMDHLANRESRVKYLFDNTFMHIDNLTNISSNKLCTLVSRSEIKDYIDFYFICRNKSNDELRRVYENAKLKDRVFEDFPTAAYQIEKGTEYITGNYDMMPALKLEINKPEIEKFYRDLTQKIYSNFN
ncbi:MAG: nucleotidyl transferase AbiEii/AbiGii toxin family protein [Ignavibacteria bacterium]|nr:nucleotidyl transferase AbiEii/AbiGii toxin family protein [Ignavibacteria bacterium]